MHTVVEDNNNLSKDLDSTNSSTTSNTEFKDYIIC